MDSFVSTLGVAGGIAIVVVAAIIVLSLYFTVTSRFSNKGLESLTIRGVLGKNTLATVHMAGGTSLERVRLVGFANAGSGKHHVPFDLSGLVILEDEGRQRTLVRAKDVRIIVVPPQTA